LRLENCSRITGCNLHELTALNNLRVIYLFQSLLVAQMDPTSSLGRSVDTFRAKLISKARNHYFSPLLLSQFAQLRPIQVCLESAPFYIWNHFDWTTLSQ
jgi:hypothetical protein